jgi:hypothetical protein
VSRHTAPHLRVVRAGEQRVVAGPSLENIGDWLRCRPVELSTRHTRATGLYTASLRDFGGSLLASAVGWTLDQAVEAVARKLEADERERAGKDSQKNTTNTRKKT